MTRPRSFLERFPSWVEEYLASREAKAEKIRKVLQRQIALTEQVSLLDVGCSQGRITQKLGENLALAVGVDPTDEEGRRPGFHFIRADGCYLPLRSATFDVLVLNHILEHVPAPQRLLDEAWRVLRPGGVCYLATPNRYSLMEPHYRLPFLSWLPRPLADRYVRLSGRGQVYLDYPLGYRKLRQLTRRFQFHNQTGFVLADPEFFFQGDASLKKLTRWLRWFPRWSLDLLMPLLPVYIFILRKTERPAEELPGEGS